MKDEDFDKKEFDYCRKMLHHRTKEQLLLEQDRIKMYPIKIEIHSEMKHDAELYLEKLQAEESMK